MTEEVITLFLLAISMCEGGQIVHTSWRNTGLNDVAFTSNLLFTSAGRSRVDCSHQCARIQNCATFTFSPQSSTCRGHSSFMTSAAIGSPDPGSRTFQRLGESECDPGDLQSTFLRYPQCRIYPHSGSNAGYMSAEACHANCASKSWCVVIEYHNLQRCIQEPQTALDLPNNWDPNFNWDPTDFYQRTCV
ncbi:hypothetical protein BaRGS_00008848 [Batillaria attramentaria]|uniref:Apple domain-containing protein n=1 Tax=Batillaria attramentaria TaxID=370345 RepID=A0ABD0LKI5_9CAEN